MQILRVASCLLENGGDRTDRLRRGLELLDQAGRQRVDLACLSEMFAENLSAAVAEPVDGPLVSAVTELAQKHKMIVVTPICELADDGRKYNAAAVINRDGTLLGCYRKNIPYWSEAGITPGDETPVFETDFGTLGVLICWEDQYSQPWAEVARQGAELVLWPSAYSGGRKLTAGAIWHNFYIVSCSRAPDSSCIDICGEEISHTVGGDQTVLHEIDLDRQMVHCNFNGKAVPKMLEELDGKIHCREFLREGWWLLASTDPAVSVRAELAKRNIETLRQYTQRSGRAISEIRAAGDPMPQTPGA